MKKFGIIFTISLCLSFLVGCGGGNTTKLPETKYEKVQYALNGVEKSLKNQKSSSRSVELLPRAKRSEAEALNAIYNIFPEGEAGQPDFKYDEPPMIQFQYIKKTLEKIGNGFDFGVKYQSTITGTIYYDFSTGKDTEKAEFKQDYSLDFSLYINIDDNDLITCKTLFDIDYTHNNDVHHQDFYAELFLDYDMKKTDANYKLKLYAVDDCSSFIADEERYFSAEFDYVDVSNDAIVDWGKIGYSANKGIFLDDAHTSLSDYLFDQNLKFKPTIQLYKDGKRYQRNQLNDSQATQAVTIACDELGVNGTDVKYKEYIRLSSTNQPVLKTCYEEFSRIFGRDLAYNIVYTGAKEDEHGGGGEGGDRVDASWPTQELINDGYNDVPGFLSKTATFNYTREYASETDSYAYFITVSNYQSDDFARYIRTLIEKNFVETKQDETAFYFHQTADGKYDYGIIIYSMFGSYTIIISKVTEEQQPQKENIIINNAETYTGEYSTYEEVSYRSASEVAAVVASVSGGQISADAIVQYVIAGSSRTYKIYFDLSKYSGADIKDNYSEYIKQYSDWRVIQEGSAFYKSTSDKDVLVMADKDSSKGLIEIHSFTFIRDSIEQILDGQGQGGGGEGGGGHGQDPVRVSVSLYEVDAKKGDVTLVNTYTFDDGELINVEATFGPGEYYLDEGCIIPIKENIEVHDGMVIFRKVNSQSQTQGNIVIIDANTKQELVTFTDVIGATIKGGAIFNYVLFKDEACTQMVGLNEEVTIGEETITFYCRDYSEVDYVTLTVNTYINGVLSPYHTRDFGVRRGEIMNNIASNSFPTYYSDSSYYDSNYTMTLNDVALSPYSSDLIAFTENGVLNIYCNNDWCNVYHITTGSGDEFDILWEGSLGAEDVFLHGNKYYTVKEVKGKSVTIESTSTAYYFTLCYVYNGKVIVTEKNDFPISYGVGYTIYIDPSQDPNFFLDRELTQPLMPEEGENEVVFNHSFTLYTRFAKY